MFSLYILECSDGTLYTGHTDNLDERMRQHEAGTCDSYTSARRPLRLMHVQEFESRYEALAMERKLKGWSRAKKLAYIAGDWNSIRLGERQTPPSALSIGASTSRSATATLSANGYRNNHQ